MDKETLKVLANKLMFTMNECEYDTLQEEFETILKQMDLIGKIKDIEKVEPLIYTSSVNPVMREDEVLEELELDDILLNSGDTLYNQVKVPKVVE